MMQPLPPSFCGKIRVALASTYTPQKLTGTQAFALLSTINDTYFKNKDQKATVSMTSMGDETDSVTFNYQDNKDAARSILSKLLLIGITKFEGLE